MDIVSRIKRQLAHLRPSEQKVAKFILSDLSTAAHSSINELAEQSGVSLACITRLAKVLDCKNVRDLKFKLAQSAAVGERYISDKVVDKKDSPPIYQAIHNILDLNKGLIAEPDVQQASERITKANHILIFGVGGGSTVMAEECHYRFFRLDVKSNAYSDPMVMRMTAATVDKGDVVLCLSLGGFSPDVKDAAEIAKEYGAHVIAICPHGNLSEVAEIHLPIETHEADFIFNPSTSRYVMLAAIDMLASEIAIKNQRKCREKLRRLKLHLDEHRKEAGQRLPLGD